MIREAITKLAEKQPLTREDALQSLRDIMGGNATSAQIAAYITALQGDKMGLDTPMSFHYKSAFY